MESFAISQVVVFIVIAIAYGLILVKIRQSSKNLSDEKASRYRNSAKIMIIFVFVFFLQWWSPALCSMWSFFQIPPIPIVLLVVVGVNLGGVYNSIAYTLIRKRFTRVASSEQNGASVGT